MTFLLSYSIAANASGPGLPGLNIAMAAAFFDPRIDLDTLWNCEIVAFSEINPSAEYSVTLSTNHLTDEYGLIKRPDPSSECAVKTTPFFSDPASPYVSYTMTALTSVTPADTSSNAEKPFGLIFRFATHIVPSTTSEPGITKLDIVLNAGALVGGIQFFAWFLTIFAAE